MVQWFLLCKTECTNCIYNTLICYIKVYCISYVHGWQINELSNCVHQVHTPTLAYTIQIGGGVSHMDYTVVAIHW